ncbi:hypothetical protein FEM48_Zijuj08G0041700 [Ziziphus jujuba var. spinosa]|uniref:Bifunctional inhibitor/plant lipid transfer protein/seed storage helical domain-containing protein n=1 Tax=Ziziphus jujuba var. spinosa TaxID=714518 RepID=A0A978UWX3_ZIZJJ|nr:hypothetical protein FEM48_Zijuj08G0041700 [Ziziphus jujuba var. spinosa]
MHIQVALLMLAILLLLSSSTVVCETSAPTCTVVAQELAPCLSFLKGSGDEQRLKEGDNKPSKECCQGVKDLSSKAKTKLDRQRICQCTKIALSQIGTYDPSRIPLISKDCGLSFTLPPIDKNTDCSKY